MTLDPQAALVLELAEKSDRPPLESLEPPAARVQYSEMVASAEGASPGGLSIEDSSIPGPAGDVPVRIYQPVGAERPLPLLIYFHGGGFVIGDLNTHDIPCRQLSLAADCLVVSVDYRLAPEHPFPAPVDDAWAVTRWIVDHAEGLGADPTRIAVGGDSAGGNLAAVVCHRAKRQGGPSLAYQLLIYPATDVACAAPSYQTLGKDYRLTIDLMRWFMDHYFSAGGDRGHPTASPLHATDFSGLPPALVLIAGYDPLKDEGRAYAATLKSAGVETRLVEYDGMIHGFITMGGLVDAAADAMRVCGEALAEVFSR